MGGGGKGSSGPSKKELKRMEANYQTQIDNQQKTLVDYQNRLDTQIKEQEVYAEEVAAKQEANRIQVGQAGRDTAYGDYMNAAGVASDYVNSEVRAEASQAALLGIDYNITDEQKSARVNDYFATVWGAGDQQNLEAQFAEWGDPQDFGGFAVTRGEGGSYGAASPGNERTVASSGEAGYNPDAPGGSTVNILTDDDDEETLGGGAGILG